jgi:hypothetical protein
MEPGRRFSAAAAYGAQARLRMVEWEAQDRVRSRGGWSGPNRPARSARRLDRDDLLDREWAEFMLANPRQYPAYVGTSLTTLVRAVRARRLEAEAERRAFRWPKVPPPPNYSRFFS